MEEVGEEIIAYPKLRTTSVRVAHGGEEPGFKAMECITLLSIQVPSFEEPLFGFRGNLVSVAVDAFLEGTVRDKVGKNDFGWGGRGGGHRGGWHCGRGGRGRN